MLRYVADRFLSQVRDTLRSFPREREPRDCKLRSMRLWVPTFVGTNGGWLIGARVKGKKWAPTSFW
jgi:hypothetical protein